ncbi:MAG: hypothetical protein FJX35_18430 [Alphaproteobacteria bacterium]|nr:hypothetical protein [Alphaproteobacteria bacterium]
MSADGPIGEASCIRLFWTVASEIRRVLRTNLSDRAKLDQVEMLLREAREDLTELNQPPA